MKKTFSLCLLMLTLLSTYHLAIAQSTEDAKPSANQEAVRPEPIPRPNALVGSWLISLNGQTPGGVKAIGAFLEGGVYIGDQQGNVNVDPVPQVGGVPVIFSDQYGSWLLLRARQYVVTFQYLIYGGAKNAAFLGIGEIRGLFRLNEAKDEWAGTFQGKITDPDGNVIATSEGTATAKRIRIKPFMKAAQAGNER